LLEKNEVVGLFEKILKGTRNLHAQAAIGSRSATAGSLHGQAAIEYLMPYGWALLAIVIVIAILLILNPFSAPQGCRFDQIGFTCVNPVITTGGAIFAKITNGNNNAVYIYAVNCTTDKSPTAPASGLSAVAAPPILKTLQRQETYELNDSGVLCYKAGTTTPFGSSAGTEFSGKIWVFYKNEEDGPSYPYRTTSANVVTKTVAP